MATAKDEPQGVFESGNVYNQQAIARILGLSEANGECSKFVLRKLLHDGLPFALVGRQYLVTGHNFNLWVQEHSKPWDEHPRLANRKLKEAAGSLPHTAGECDAGIEFRTPDA